MSSDASVLEKTPCFKVNNRNNVLHEDPPQPINQEGMKHTDCPFYDLCLNYAAKCMWNSWSCGKCANHLLAPIHERMRYIEQYYQPLAQIYPEFREKYERFIES